MLPAQPNQSLITAMKCLEEIVSSHNPIGSRELARLVNEEHTKISRLLKTFLHLGYVEQTEKNKYKPGSGIHVLSALSLNTSRLLNVSINPIKKLLKTGHIVGIGVLWKDKVSYIFHGNDKMPFENCIGAKNLFPAKDSSIGKVISAYLKSIKDKEDEEIIKNGYAISEFENKQYSIAAPIGAPKPIAGIAIGSIDNLNNKDVLVNLLTEASNEINQLLKEYL